MKLWKDTKRGNAQKLLDWLLSKKRGNGWSLNLYNEIHLAELRSSSSSVSMTKHAIMQVLDEMSRSKKKTVDDFEKILEQHLRTDRSTAGQRLSRWQFFIPIEVAVKTNIARRLRIRILGKDFSFLRFQSVGPRLDKNTREKLRVPTASGIQHIPDVFLSVSSLGTSWRSAWDKITPAFDALRGLIELSLNSFAWRITYGGSSARRKVPHPLWMAAQKKGEDTELVHFVTEEEGTTDCLDLTDELFTVIKKNTTILKREPEPNSTLSLIADCLRLYSQAMDTRFNHLCFLGFWQLAEAITHSEAVGGQTDRVVARIAWHGTRVGLIGSGYTESLLLLGRKRNNVVHRGIQEIEDDDVNVIKVACEVAIRWLFQAYKSLPTVGHVESYYKLREINRSQVKALKACIKYLDKEKHEDKHQRNPSG